MYLRKIQNQKTEVSIDEPLNVDWDGNELLLSDILGTDGDTVNRELEQEVERSALRGLVSGLGSRSSVLCGCDLGWTGVRNAPKRGGSGYHWDTRNPISRGWKKENHTAAAGGNARSTEWNWPPGRKHRRSVLCVEREKIPGKI